MRINAFVISLIYESNMERLMIDSKMKNWKASLFLLSVLFFAADCRDKMTEETATLTYAPNVPPVIKRTSPAKVTVRLETQEKVMKLADGVEYTFWTFGGSVPGPFIRVREGDLVDFHLSNNASSKVPHNIDLHAVTGPGGGAASSLTAPGHTSNFSFTALNPGLYIYHCATAPVGMHIANGMYGLIYVQPREALPEVNKEYYIVQSEFYTKGKNGDHGLQDFDLEKAVKEQPEYVVFNGSVGALTGDHAITANVGERVRLFVGNGGPNLVSSFHVIGEIFDQVYTEGGVKANQNHVQTTLVPAGGSAIVEFGVEVPGNYPIVDHSIFRTFNKGSLGILKVSGSENKTVYSGKLNAEKTETVKKPSGKEMTMDERIIAGKNIYAQTCIACHQAEGQGVKGTFPPLAKSDYMMNDKARSVQVVVKGLSGEITVNGEKYNSVMPPQYPHLNDEDIANVLTYVRNSFGNKGEAVTAEEVKRAK